MAETILATEGLVKRFGGLVATDRLELAVAEGEVHAVIGPNGAGKTTLVAQIAGELRPDAGTIRFLGEDITALPAHRRSLQRARALVPDHQHLSGVHRARQCRARGAGACRAQLPLLDARRGATRR